ncbi:MAG: hypothetical protein JWR20_1295 [Marmoricola sp.]|nr:hypothetical protein [Marmoricola sp.]
MRRHHHRGGPTAARRTAAKALTAALALSAGLVGALAIPAAAGAAVPTSATPSTVAPAQVATSAPTPPAPKAVDYSATFKTTDQNLAGPGDAPAPADVYHPWFSKSWNETGGFNGVTDVTVNLCAGISDDCDVTSYYGARLSAATNGQVGLGDTLHGYQPGKVSVTYPVTTQVTAPADDSFAPGDTVSITTQKPAPTTASSISTTSPTATGFSVDGTFKMHADAGGDICFIGCVGGSLFNLNLGSDTPQALFSLDASDLTMVRGMGLGHCFGAAEDALLGAATYANAKNYCFGKGYVKVPDPQIGPRGAGTTVTGTALSAQNTDQFIVVPVNAMSWLGRLATLPNGFPTMTAGFNGTSVNYDLLNVALTAIISQSRQVSFTPVVNMTMDFGRSVAYKVLSPQGSTDQASTGSSATFPLGSTVRVTVPDTLTVHPSVALADTSFRNSTSEALSGSARIKALKVWGDIGGVGVAIGPAYDSGNLDLGRTGLHDSDRTWQLGGFGQAQDLAPFQLVVDPPPVPSPRTVTPVEGSSFADQVVGSFHDPDPKDATKNAAENYGASITWGDGHTSTGTVSGTNDSFVVTGTNTYEQRGSYPVDVKVTDLAVPTAYAVARSRAVVADAPLSVVDEPTLTSVEGTPTPAALRIASFTDGNPFGLLRELSARVAWGDGTTEAATVVRGTGGRFDVLAPAHNYRKWGSPGVVVSILSDGGSTATARPSMTTADAPLHAGPAVTNGSLSGSSTPVLLWPNPGNAVVATFTDENIFGSAGDYTATVTWGDGTSSAGTVSAADNGSGFKVTASHTYTDAQLGQHDISVFIRDDGTSSTTARTSLLAYTFASGAGAFSLGDRSVAAATSGTLLNFWGSQWSRNNQLSGAPAPASYKGFVSSPPTRSSAPSTCPTAGAFTTEPGSSGAAPAAVPAYMAVMLASQVTKDGSTVSGGAAHWVVVKTRSGYGPSAGNDGWGTVVAGLC